MPKYPARQKSSGYISRDANDPLYTEAEDRVYRWLLAGNFEVEDLRSQRTYCDFNIVSRTGNGAKWSLDVKCDSLAYTTGRLAFETHMWRGDDDKPSWAAPGWAMHDELSYAAFVLPQTWKLILVDMDRVRGVLNAVEMGLVNPEPGDWFAFTHKGNDNLHARGIAIGIEYLHSMGCIRKETTVGE